MAYLRCNRAGGRKREVVSSPQGGITDPILAIPPGQKRNMCGRIVQKSGPLDYVERIFPNPRRVLEDPAGPRYNIPPGTRPLTLHRLAGDFEVDRQWWTWRPSGSKYPMNCARLDKILGNKWPWKMLTGHGRILVPADGWYEWKALNDEPKPPKQPEKYGVRLRFSRGRCYFWREVSYQGIRP